MWNEKTVAILVAEGFEGFEGSEIVGPRKVLGPCKGLQEAGEGKQRRSAQDREMAR